MDDLTQPTIPFDNSYARLPERFFTRLDPTPVKAPALIRVNEPLAAELGLDPAQLAAPGGVAALSGNRPPAGAAPLAQVYAGHQFGGWSAQLGDGRAILLGEVVDRAGRRRDIQLKGSGPTPYSRMGDGRAPLGPVLREYIVSEAMAALGAPTTRALAAVATGETVLREDGPLPGGVITRVAASHIRVGTFQYFGARRDEDALARLVDYCIRRHWPEATGAAGLLEAVIAAQARLIAKWMSLGFIHGVMNTDNMAISGETIDYGPCAFLDGFDPAKKFSFIDRQGRYAYANQPGIGHWNLSRLAVALIPLLGETEEAAVNVAQGALDAYPGLFEAEWRRLFGLKLGLEGPDAGLAEELLALMAAEGVDFTLTFRRLADAAAGEEDALRSLFADGAALDAWLGRWRAAPGARDAAAMRAANPLYIPRNHLVEQAIRAGYAGDYRPFEALLEVLSNPFDMQEGHERYAAPPALDEVVANTFCGT
ncbi:YdiU family protein [Pikeienuella piscinae]|uniref:Protein nucleotidyltransferase YdiU n=1 Tax=Pikeienuella piscinae TaxID=2748098 RepID=A0A7L5BSK7_9RHOB|nr:YdiU family protein [Pikeienuella piscinae]QIE54085.1 YdiU family protein [Pikeienuella piscinae]